jgi:hypothetical protein
MPWKLNLVKPDTAVAIASEECKGGSSQLDKQKGRIRLQKLQAKIEIKCCVHMKLHVRAW